MRKLELWLGVAASVAGIVLSVLLRFGALPQPDVPTLVTTDAQTLRVHAMVLLIANALGIVGALMVRRYHVIASVVMAGVTAVVLYFGFPWQSIPAVMYIISVVLALVPVRMEGQP